jgi:aerobic-type carbon monoxide dehydrogenase small subunit (CoxS/CutS family)
MILSTKAFLEKNPNPSASEVASALSGNICRCGAYIHIARSVLNAAKKMERQKSGNS